MYMKGLQFYLEGIRKWYTIFYQKNGKGLDLVAEPSSIKLRWGKRKERLYQDFQGGGNLGQYDQFFAK